MASCFLRTGVLLFLVSCVLRAAEPATTVTSPAIKALIVRAEANDREAQLALGQAYTHGEGVTADPLEAARWLMNNYSAEPSAYVREMLLELGFQHPDLGDRYLAKYSPPDARALAAKAKAGDRAARFDFAQRQLSGRGVFLDHGRAETTLSQLAEQGHAPAMLVLARLYRDHEDNTKALEWGNRALKANAEGAQAFVAQLLETTKPARERAAQVAAKVPPAPAPTPPAADPAKGSVPPATNAVSPQVAEGNRLFAEGFKEYQAQNFGQALKLFTQAAALGNSTAMLNLGVMHEQGQATEKNLEQAVAWFEKAAAAGQKTAIPQMLSTYRTKLVFQRGLIAYKAENYPVALAEWKKAAEAGESSAMFNLAVMYEKAQGVDADPVAALAWVEKAVAAGYKPSVEATLKRLKGRAVGIEEYKQGDAAEQANELVAARGWFEKAAAAGNVSALTRLAYFHSYGITVVADKKKAQELYQRAADTGDPFAEMELDALKAGDAMNAFMESQKEMKRLARTIDGSATEKFSALSTATPTQAEIDALIKKSRWTSADVLAALKRGVKHRALAVAIATDKMTDFYDGDYEQLIALPEMRGREDYDRLGMVLVEQRKPGAGQWARDAAKAAIAARRAQLGKLPPPSVDSAELRAKALAGDVAALYAVTYLREEKRPLGAFSPELTKKTAELKTLVQQQQFKPAYWLLEDGLVHNNDKTKVNVAQAVAYYRASAEAGDARGAEKFAAAYLAPGEVGVARNYLEAEQWYIEAGARGTDDDFYGMKPEFSLYLLYSYTAPIGFGGLSMSTDDAALRWARELIRRGGQFAEHAKLSLANQGRELAKKDLEVRLAALPPEVPPFPAAELTKLETAARAGDVSALLKLADAYATGRGTRQHDVKALDYFQQAAAKGSAVAMRRLSEIYQKGYGVKPDDAARIAWLRKAGDAGDTKALMEVATLLKGAEMLAVYEKAAAAGEKDAFARIANAHRYGWNEVPKDGAKFIAAMERSIAVGYTGGYEDIARYYKEQGDKPNTVLWYRKAVAAGEKHFRDELASALFDHGEKEAARAIHLELANEGEVASQMMTAAFLGEAGDSAGAENWYRKAAAGPASADQKRAAGFVREYDEEKNAAPGTLLYFRKRANAGDVEAPFQYGWAISATKRDEALRWIRTAAESGHALATSVYANELAKTKREDATAWLKIVAAKGNIQAQLLQALELAGTDKPAALTGIEKAAAAGNVDAKYRLGMMLFNGTEMPKDATRGLTLVKESAEGGFPAAQADYGRVLVVGIPGSVTADPATGVVFLEKAAQQRLPQAVALLGEIYERGMGVPVNPRKALEYYLAAKKLGVTQVDLAIQRLQIQLSGKTPPPQKASPADKR
ncbi:tetratricopeptide repeat protein [Oleiharenicola lentus]|uniref:tetratricopeptide repeat protein n=1 Tax=Oleiharenicola lentus TaxID=2508720 RepID=UPI003F669B75